MADDKPNIANKLIQHALTTAVGVAVTFYVTKAIKDEDYKHDQAEKEKQRTDASIVNSEKIMAYESKLDSLTRENIRLRMQLNNGMSNSSDGFESVNTGNIEQSAVSNAIITGQYITSDGSVQWSFNNGRVVVGGIGSYAGMTEGSGAYSASGGRVTGSVNVSKLFYMPYTGSVAFNLSLNYDNTALVGNLTDPDGTVTPVVLYKQ